MKLSKLANILNGAAFRTGIESLPQGTAGIIQLKDLTENGTVDLSELSCISTQIIKGKFMATPQDILIRTRGANFKAAKLNPGQGEWAVASPISILKIVNNQVFPEYLLWFLNLSRTQEYFRSMAEGTSLKHLKKTDMDDLDVVLPPLEQQRCIAELAALQTEELQIAEKLAGKREQLLERILMQIASGS